MAILTYISKRLSSIWLSCNKPLTPRRLYLSTNSNSSIDAHL